MSEKIIKRNCMTCKNRTLKNTKSICKDCSRENSMPIYSNWEWNGNEEGCEFCRDHTIIDFMDMVELEITDVIVDDGENKIRSPHLKVTMYDGTNREWDSVKINYCPMCGKRLED